MYAVYEWARRTGQAHELLHLKAICWIITFHKQQLVMIISVNKNNNHHMVANLKWLLLVL